MKLNLPTHWIDPDPTLAVPAELLRGLGGNELLARALVNRGVTTWEQARGFLDPQFYQPADPFDLPDMQRVVDRLQAALRKGECIGVWGDFDVDGQTATSLLVGVLRELSANVQYHVPVRAQESHGVNLPGLVKFLDAGVDLVLTCDTGISAHDATQYARERGVDFIITDHHSLPETLPDAYAVVNPQRLSPEHPLRTLAGVGVAYQLAKALCECEGKPELASKQLDLVALGCVADVAGLSGDVRYLVQLGLAQLRNPHRAGLQAIYERAELDPSRLTEQHIGFVIGPRLNAIGRLADANPVVDFLTTDDSTKTADFAARLEGLNSERRFMTEQVLQGALAMIERDPADSPVLILNHPEWPGGVNGIVASRLVELFNKPAILLTSPADKPASGSARSVEGINITEAIAAGADLLLGFGGHPMAAGMSLDPANLPEFRQRVANSVKQQAVGLDLTRRLAIDAYLHFDDLTLETVADLERLAPFGAGNPAILLAVCNVKAVEVTAIGKTGEHLQVMIEDENGTVRRVLWWQGVRDLIPEDRFDLAFTARTSNYRGGLEVQLEWVASRERVRDQPEAEKTLTSAVRQVLDYRASSDPLKDLAMVTAKSESVIWREGSVNGEPKGLLRAHLVPAEILVIWNPPPGRFELKQALDQVQPEVVALFANHGTSDDPQVFLTQLGGLVRHALRTRAGEIAIGQFAGLLNQREDTVRLGIRWLIARGFVRSIEMDDRTVVLAEAGVPDMATAGDLEKAIRIALEETAAFRSFYLRADPSGLLAVS